MHHEPVLRCCAVGGRGAGGAHSHHPVVTAGGSSAAGPPQQAVQQAVVQRLTMARYSKAYRSREDGTTSVARVYADINEKRPPEYWDYENLQVQVSSRGWLLVQRL